MAEERKTFIVREEPSHQPPTDGARRVSSCPATTIGRAHHRDLPGHPLRDTPSQWPPSPLLRPSDPSRPPLPESYRTLQRTKQGRSGAGRGGRDADKRLTSGPIWKCSEDESQEQADCRCGSINRHMTRQKGNESSTEYQNGLTIPLPFSRSLHHARCVDRPYARAHLCPERWNTLQKRRWRLKKKDGGDVAGGNEEKERSCKRSSHRTPTMRRAVQSRGGDGVCPAVRGARLTRRQHASRRLRPTTGKTWASTRLELLRARSHPRGRGARRRRPHPAPTPRPPPGLPEGRTRSAPTL